MGTQPAPISVVNESMKGDLMRTWRYACIATLFAVGMSTAAHADEWNKLTYLTFSGPVNMPGITLPAGTYRFELMDPDSTRRVIRVSDKEGTKNYGIFLSISDQKAEPSDNPVVMFKETPAGSPQAIQSWFYPGETHGYEFVYPHDQAMKIAKASHQPVLSMTEPAASTAVGTSGTSGTSGTTPVRSLPATASPLPFMALLSGLAFAGALGVRVARKSLA